MALVTHPIYAKEWSFSSSTSSFDAPPPFSLSESTSHAQSQPAASNKRRAQDIEWGDDDDGSRRKTVVWSQNTSCSSKKAKLSEPECSETSPVTVITDSLGRSLAAASDAPKMERVLLFIVDALTTVCAPPSNQTQNQSPSSPSLLLPASLASSSTPVQPESPALIEGSNSSSKTVESDEPENQTPSSPSPSPSPSSLPLASRTRVGPLKPQTTPTSPLSGLANRAPLVRKMFAISEACTGRTEQKLGRWVLAKNHFLSVRCLDPRTQNIEWQQSLRNIGWEPLHPFFQAQAEAEAEFEAAAASAVSSSSSSTTTTNNAFTSLSAWIEDDFDGDFCNEYGEGVEEEEDCWSDEDEELGEGEGEGQVDFELPQEHSLGDGGGAGGGGAHTDVWDSGVSLTLTPAPGSTCQQGELSLEDCRC